MPCDFEVIEVYRNLCEGKTTLEEVMMQNDQQVPQTLNLYQDPSLSNVYDVKPNVNDVIVDEFQPAYLPSAGCTTITEVPDQQVISGNSPSHLTNLDLYTCADTTFYDVTTDQKPPEMSWIEEESLDADVNDVLYHLATKEILDECQMMNISKDPTQWTTEDVSKWIRHTCKKYDIPQVELEMFHMNGKCLCLLSEVDFLLRTENGSHLFSQLEIWKNFFKIEYEQSGSPQYHDTTMVDSTSFDTYSLTPSSPSGSSLDSIPSTVVSSPVSSPVEQYSIPDKKRSVTTPRPTEHKQTIHLWQFLRELLMKPETFSGCIKWIDRTRGIFKIEDSGRVAKEWGRRKNRPAMNYDKLSRSIRQYYKKGIIKKTEHSKRLVYQFCPPYL